MMPHAIRWLVTLLANGSKRKSSVELFVQFECLAHNFIYFRVLHATLNNFCRHTFQWGGLIHLEYRTKWAKEQKIDIYRSSNGLTTWIIFSFWPFNSVTHLNQVKLDCVELTKGKGTVEWEFLVSFTDIKIIVLSATMLWIINLIYTNIVPWIRLGTASNPKYSKIWWILLFITTAF